MSLLPTVLAMNCSGGSKQAGARPRGRRSHRPQEQVYLTPLWEGGGKGTLSPGSLGNAGEVGVGADGSYSSQRAQGLLSHWSPPALGHSEFRVSSRAGSLRGPGATSGILQDGDVRLSKALSYALRHGALKLGLPMGAGK